MWKMNVKSNISADVLQLEGRTIYDLVDEYRDATGQIISDTTLRNIYWGRASYQQRTIEIIKC